MATGNTSLEHLSNLYQHVIEDVIRNMKEEFLNEGVDPELLEDLKKLWLHKLNLSGAVNRPAKAELMVPSKTPSKDSSSKKSNFHASSSTPSTSTSSRPTPPHALPQATPLTLPPPPPLTPTISTQETVIQHAPSRTTPSSSHATSTPPSLVLHPSMLAAAVGAQTSASSSVPPLVIPSPAGQVAPLTLGNVPRITSVSSAAGLGGISPAVNPFTSMNLGVMNPTVGQVGQLAQSMVPIQTHEGTMLVPFQTFLALNQLKQQQQQQTTPSVPVTQPPLSSEQQDNVVQLDGTPPILGGAAEPLSAGDGTRVKSRDHRDIELSSSFHAHKETDSQSRFQIVQLDGSMARTGGGGADASSSDEDSDLDDDSSEDDVTTEQKQSCGSPLNSDDDVDDGDETGPGMDFETQDTIVCQWEKVYRVKNKWKFQLKDGIMHLGGFDYVFHKMAGEADW